MPPAANSSKALPIAARVVGQVQVLDGLVATPLVVITDTGSRCARPSRPR